MFLKYATAGLVGSVLLATTAFAEAPKALSESSLQNTWRVSKVVGLKIYNDNNENVGSVNDLLMDKAGNIKAAVISVGGFLGVGSRYIAIPLDQMTFSNEPVSYTSSSNAPAMGNRPASTTTTGAANNPPLAKANAWYPDHAILNASKDELQKMQEFKYSE